MKETGLMFKAPLVRSILDGTKSQTRRVAKDVKHPDLGNVYTPGALVLEREPQHVIDRACPYGGPRDRIYAREAWAPNTGSAGGFLYRADHGGAASFNRIDLKTGVWTHSTSRWWPSIHMPKHAARIWRDITGVRLERLQQISDADCWAEGAIAAAAPSQFSPYSVMGVDGKVYLSPRDAFRQLWESTGGDWSANPWVWVIDFKLDLAQKGHP